MRVLTNNRLVKTDGFYSFHKYYKHLPTMYRLGLGADDSAVDKVEIPAHMALTQKINWCLSVYAHVCTRRWC